MPYLLIRHKVKDFATWKPVFDAHGEFRKANGSKGGMVCTSADDPNEVVILLEWDTVENARKFTESPGLREAMEKAGVADKPDVYHLKEAGNAAS